MRIVTKKKAAVLVAVAAVAIAGAGGAYAYWTTSGEGSATGAAGTDTAFTITQVGTVTGLVPGVAQTVDFKVNNGANFAQYLTGVTANVASTTSGNGGGPACTVADYVVDNVLIAAGQIPAGQSQSGTARVLLKNTDANQDNCKGATVTLAFASN
ncbi:hypothetical protein GCM10009547_47640 [Sporichthya brevicatena]|uniref:SipW-cognate class signal peptide n=1 Tax=Sporichthya brevicatena TaxID=171442 RepID=A0ABN1HC78_9ACTN